MSILLKCYESLLTDVSKLSGVPLGAPDDLDMNWVLIEAPWLDKCVLRWLEEENSSPNDITFPEWLTPLWTRFCESRNPWILKLLRQVLVFGYKSRFEPNDQQIKEACASFQNTDQEVADFDAHLLEAASRSVTWRTARSIVSRVIGDIDWSRIIPKHGPGAVFPPFDPSVRSDFKTIYASIEQYYPFFENFNGMLGSYPNAVEAMKNEWLTEQSDIICKLCCVPKDSRGPRLISVHPRESIWIQQGQRALLERKMERLRPFISLDDQTVNGSLALASSFSQEYSTLDLSEASDRLSAGTVRFLFGAHAYQWISCSRASFIKMLDGSVVKLAKFAPMGNALCFPIESLCFLALVRAGIAARYGTCAASRCYVFGDDIIVPTSYCSGAIEGLESAGLKVNRDKSFRKGFFRESCGVDAYRGINVTPHRMKCHTLSSMSDLDSLCALAKNLRVQGFEETASTIYSAVRWRLDGCLSLTNNPHSAGIVEYVDRDLCFVLRNEPSLRWNSSLHRYETKTRLPRSVTERVASYWYNVQDSLLSLERANRSPEKCRSNTVLGSDYPIPGRTRYRTGWTPVVIK